MAVRDVNLVPEPVLQRRYARRHATGWAVAYGLVITALLGGYFVHTQGVIARRRHATSEDDVRKRLAGAVAEIETRKRELERLAFVREVSHPVGPVATLGRLAAAMDPGTWLTHLSLTIAPGTDTGLTMEGRALSNASLGAMIRGLSESDSFTDVVLGSSSELRGRGSGEETPDTVVQFRVRAKAVTGQAP